MEIAIAFIVGGVCGWVVARLTRRREPQQDKRTFRPNKRQREILATLPPDPVRPSIEELVDEEAAALGVDQIPGAEGVPLGVRLRVWKRDHQALDSCPARDHQFVVRAGLDAATVTEADVRLECLPRSR